MRIKYVRKLRTPFTHAFVVSSVILHDPNFFFFVYVWILDNFP